MEFDFSKSKGSGPSRVGPSKESNEYRRSREGREFRNLPYISVRVYIIVNLQETNKSR